MRISPCVAAMAATVLLVVVMCSASNANVQQPVTIKVVNPQTGLSSIVLGNTTDAMPPEGYPFTVKVVLQGTVTNLFTYQVAVKYNATALNCTGIWINTSDPTFIFRQYRTEPIIPPSQPPFIEGGVGYVFLGASLLYSHATVTDGLLCQINFTSKAQGTSLIEVVPTNMQPADTFLSTGYVADILFDIGPHFSVTVATKTPPVASFFIFTQNPEVNQRVDFNASESYAINGSIVSYFWDFGDDSNLTSASPETYHIFARNGFYRVKLTVTDDGGLCGSARKEVLVGALPVPNISYLRYYTIGEIAFFDASLSNDADGYITRAILDFGDRNVAAINVDNPSDLQIMHRYAVSTGIFTLNLTVFDNDGLHSSLQFEIEITAPAESNVFIVVLDHNEYQGTIATSSELSGFVFDSASKEIRFSLSGETGTEGNCEITIPRFLLEANSWVVKTNGDNHDFLHSHNQTHTIISLSYVHQSVLNVAVKGIWAVPEYPASSIVLFLMLMLALPLTCFFKRQPKSRTESRTQETTD